MRTAATSLTPTIRSRILLAAIVFVLESLAVGSLPHPWFRLHQIMAAPIAAGAAFLLLVWRNRRLAEVPIATVAWRFVWLHAGALAALGAATFMLLQAPANYRWTPLWYLSIAILVATLTLALFPLRSLGRALANLRWAWLVIALMAAAAMSARTCVRWLWNAPDSSVGHGLQAATFASVKALLGLFYARVVARPERLVLGTPKFHVLIAGECSGIEGLALVFVFTVGWLVLTRRKLRLVRAWLLVPCALLLSWILNTVRIAALIALGDAGHGKMAINGFHSEAGWILFNVVAIVFLLSAQQIAWLRQPAPTSPKHASRNRNVAAPYLIPFLAVLATAMLTHAVSIRFDWLYPLRFLVGLAALLYFRAQYRRLDWRFGWLGPLAGALVFGVWLIADRLQPDSVSLLAADLLALPGWERMLWIAARVMAAALTVPLVEELAFRGYLARRILNDDVDAVPFRGLTALSIAGSSLAFGLLHGRMWGAGVVAGVVFALVAKMRNRLGEAVAAHAAANLLIAVWVLARGDYRLW